MRHSTQRTLKRFYFVIVLFGFLSTVGQTPINWAELQGNWRLEKEFLIFKGDTTNTWTPDKNIIYNFDSNSKFTDRTSTENTVFTGTYTIDKKEQHIKFSNMTQTTSFPGSTLTDYVGPLDKIDFTVKKLTSDIFIFYVAGCDEINTDNCGSYSVCRKSK